jgi:predicted transcriptional regulator
MGTSAKTIQRQVKALKSKGYIRREERRGRSNAFDCTPLFDSLLEAVQNETAGMPEAA